MKRLKALCVAIIAAVLASLAIPALAAVASTAQARDARPPNVVFVLADDLGYADLGAYGQRRIRTPSIDRLAEQGLRFTQHYAGNAVCAPSRSVLMTGLHPGHTPIRDNREVQPEGQWPLPAGTTTIASLLKARGYVTGAFGKWGLGAPGSEGEPLRQGFDRFFGYNCQREAHNYYPAHLYDDARRVALDNPVFPAHQRLPAGADPADPRSYARFSGRQYAPDLIWEKARAFVRENRDRSFFLFVPTTVPHLALQVPEDSVAEYRGAFPETPYLGEKGYLPQPTPRAAYAAMITRLDREVGRLITLISELGLDERTIVVFTSDNGATFDVGGADAAFFRSAGELRGLKASLYEGGVRVPAIVRWTGHVGGGQVSERVTGFEDWLPTLMELTGVPAPARTDGLSFAPTLLGRPQPERPSLYREFPGYGGQQSVRAGDWKGVRQNMQARAAAGAGPPPLELYDLRADAGESRDVAAAHPDVVARLERLMAAEHTPSAVFPLPSVDTPAAGASARPGAPARPRNVISIVTDDQSTWSVGAYGNPDARTPVLDRLAREGTRFTNAFVTTPVCSPSRAGFLTGRYGIELGIRDWITPQEAADGLGLPHGTVTWPAILQGRGFRTALVGKWHLGRGPASHPLRFGFDRFYGFLDGGSTPMDARLEVDGREQVVPGPLPDRLTDEAIRFLEESRDRPFALLLHFREPHLPYGPVPEQDALALRDVDPVIPEVEGIDRAQVKAWTREHLASVHAVDRNVGRLLEAVERLGLASSTLVLFTGDNGYNIGHHGIHTKGNGYWIAGGVHGPTRPNMFDTSLRVPLLLRGPGVPAGRVVDEPVTQLDTLPSLLSLLGLPLPPGLVQRGLDFAPLLRGESVAWRDAVYGDYDLHHYALDHMRMVRSATHKLVRHLGSDGADELYDLRNDPGETRNLYGDASSRGVRDALEARLADWRRTIGDAEPTPGAACHDESRVTMGCTATLRACGADPAAVRAAAADALDEIDRLDALLSHYRRDSPLSRLNRAAASGPVAVDRELFDLLAAALRWSRESDGAFDVTVGPLMKAWGFFRDEGRVPDAALLEQARRGVGYRHVVLDPSSGTVRFDRKGVELDLGGIGKGYAVDRAVGRLRARGIRSALVNLGGSSVYGLGAPPNAEAWEVAIRDPTHRDRVAYRVKLRDRALSVAGGYERFFEKGGVTYAHIMDPRVGRPVSGVLSVAVLDDSATDGDALDDVLFVAAGRARAADPRGWRAFLDDRPSTAALVFLPAPGGFRLETAGGPVVTAIP